MAAPVGISLKCGLLIGTVLFAAGAASTQKSDDVQQMRLEAKAVIDKEMRDLPSLGERNLADIIGFSQRNGKIHPTTSLASTGPTFHSIRVSGLPGWAKVQVLGSETIHDAGSQQYLQFLYRDLTVAGTVEVYTEIYSSPDSVNISQEAGLPQDGIWSVQFIQAEAQGPQAVSVYIQAMPPGGSQRQRHLIGASLGDLSRKNAADIDACVRPIFRLLRQEPAVFEPDSKAAYQVLADLWTPEPAMTAAVNAAVAGLGADQYSDREAALGRLRELGQPGALCLLRARPDQWTAEQALRAQAFLAPYRPLSDEEADREKSDPDFLLDCLYSHDPDIRRMSLRRLHEVTGQNFDATLSGAALEEAVTKLRPRLASPSTLPAMP